MCSYTYLEGGKCNYTIQIAAFLPYTKACLSESDGNVNGLTVPRRIIEFLPNRRPSKQTPSPFIFPRYLSHSLSIGVVDLFGENSSRRSLSLFFVDSKQ